MSAPIVDLFQPVDASGDSHRALEAEGIDLRVTGRPWLEVANDTGQRVIRLAPGAAVGVGVGTRAQLVPRETLAAAPGLRAIVKYTVGVDNVDVDAATELGVLVVHSPTECNWGGVAEGIMAYMLAMLKKVRERDRHVKAGGWRDDSLTGTYLGRRHDGYGGITIGIVGLGRIGARFADLLAPWHVRLLAHDPFVDESRFVHHDAQPVDLDTLLAESDVVSLHCDLNPGTRKLIDAAALAKMKPGAILMNSARGAVVDVEALAAALAAGRLAGAVIDVLPEEPPPPGLALLGLGDRVLLSPHMITATTSGGLPRAIPWVHAAIVDVLRGRVPRHVFNLDAIPAWRARFGGQSLL